ncbi:MAG TPA: FAD binding domain-containing protein [Trebonia sp.]|nr:FAD binding domain-containing protein [Trebonia sp.]
MFPADFAYVRARSLDEALDLLDEAAEAGDEAKLIAGGQSLLPMMKLRLAVPQVLIDIAGLDELKRGGFSGSSHTIGALTTYRQLSHQRYAGRDDNPALVNGTASLVSEAPALADALAVLADPQVRARGTIGGAVAHGDPAADLPAVLLALDAEVVIAARPGRHEHKASPRQRYPDRRAPHQDQEPAVDRQTMSLDDFLQGIYETDLAEDEIVTHITIDTGSARASAYEKFPHPASHLPLAGVCAVVRVRDGVIEGAEVAVTGISPRPYRARETERLLAGAPPVPEALAAAAARVTRFSAAEEVTLLGDQHASAPYRAHLAEILTRRALARALTRAEIA